MNDRIGIAANRDDTDGLPGEAYPEPELPPCRECASAERVESIGRNKWWCGSCDIVWATSLYGDTHTEPADCNDANPRNVTCPTCNDDWCTACHNSGIGQTGDPSDACVYCPPNPCPTCSFAGETPTETKPDD